MPLSTGFGLPSRLRLISLPTFLRKLWADSHRSGCGDTLPGTLNVEFQGGTWLKQVGGPRFCQVDR
jgi:hypothetical protein